MSSESAFLLNCLIGIELIFGRTISKQFKLQPLTIEEKGEKIRRKKAGGRRGGKEGIGEESPLFLWHIEIS